MPTALYIFEDKEVVIKCHVSPTDRVDLDRLYDRINLNPMIQFNYVSTAQQVADIPTKGSLTGDRWKPLTHAINIPTHTTFTQQNLSVSYAVVNSLSSSMSKRAGESFAASASAKQKPVHCTAMIAWRINDKNCLHGLSRSTSAKLQSWRRL